MRHWVILDETRGVVVDGERIGVEAQGMGMIDEIYRGYVGNYMKYFKMDSLCKVGFVASELLLAKESGSRDVEQRKCYGTAERAIVLFNESGSLYTDTRYQATISDEENYFPSPALFVYTLANIVTGEIAIRNKYYGETNFLVLPEKNSQAMAVQVSALFADKETQSAIVGWVECDAEEHFEVRMALVGRDDNIENDIKTLIEWKN
ncbi:MAG: hypothetical protein IJL38_07745 [Bacteroidales bacterium]|nr:hypothetical protein [Bacteroidales bacterium]